MLIAQKLRKENICEYLLYMWQVENLIRAMQLDIDQIEAYIIQPYGATDQEKADIKGWYESLIEMMRMEGVQQDGHLQLNKNIIIELVDFHNLLMASGKEPGYNSKYLHILPLLTQFRQKQNEKSIHDIELCFNFQFGFMMLKMKKATITPETLKAQEEISKYMVLLSRNYQRYKAGQLELDK